MVIYQAELFINTCRVEYNAIVTEARNKNFVIFIENKPIYSVL